MEKDVSLDFVHCGVNKASVLRTQMDILVILVTEISHKNTTLPQTSFAGGKNLTQSIMEYLPVGTEDCDRWCWWPRRAQWRWMWALGSRCPRQSQWTVFWESARSRCVPFVSPHLDRTTSLQQSNVTQCMTYYRPRSEASEGYVFTGVCHFNSGGRGRWATPMVTTPPPWDQVTTPAHPGTRSQHLPPPPPLGPGHNTPPPPRDQATTPPSSPYPRTRPPHLPPPPPPGAMHRRAVRILMERILVYIHRSMQILILITISTPFLYLAVGMGIRKSESGSSHVNQLLNQLNLKNPIKVKDIRARTCETVNVEEVVGISCYFIPSNRFVWITRSDGCHIRIGILLFGNLQYIRCIVYHTARIFWIWPLEIFNNKR